MSNEKLEALKWYGYGKGELFARGVFFHGNGINRINVADRKTADDIAETHNEALKKGWDAAHALGVEEGRSSPLGENDSDALAELRENIETAFGWCNQKDEDEGDYVGRVLQIGEKLKSLREAAPVDDGRRWEIYVGTVPASSHPGSKTAAEAMRILWDMNTHPVFSMQVYSARPVKPKHVHELDGCPTLHRGKLFGRCKCGAQMVAEWKDEPTR